jgi:predicted nucleic acid-binding protein
MGALDGFETAFLDASFLIALFAKQDKLHGRAYELFEDLAEAGTAPCTIWDCLSEAITILRRHYGFSSAMALIASVPEFHLLPYDTSHRLAALQDFGRFAQKRPISFVDVLAAVVLKRELPNAPALSFDRDFRTLGLTVIR